MEDFASALQLIPAPTKNELYWLARLNFVRRREDTDTFDAVFEAIFDFELNRSARQARPERQAGNGPKATGTVLKRLPVLVDGEATSGQGLPWTSPPSVSDDDTDDPDDDESVTDLHELVPSVEEADADRPFAEMSEEELLAMCQTLERGLWQWPQRRSRRVKASKSQGQVEMRRTLRHASRTGGETLHLARTRPRQSARQVVMILDVSGSMESYVRAYLHTSRVLVTQGRMEVFAIGTDIHRITPALRHRSASEAMDQATEAVGDPFGGTKLASSIGKLLRHRLWSRFVRGAVVVVASDGWDTDPPELMAEEMQRLKRRAHRVIWINPRSAAPQFEPKVGSLAAALDHCDAVLSGHSANAMIEVMQEIAKR